MARRLVLGLFRMARPALDVAFRLKRTKDVLFVVRNEIMFQCAYEIDRALVGAPRVRTWFAFADGGGEKASSLGGRYRVRTVPLGLARALNWDLVVFPDHVGSFRASCRKIYSGHGIESGKLVKGTPYVFGDRSREEDGSILYEKIFLSSDFLADQVGRHSPEFRPRVRVVGNLLADRLWRTEPSRAERFRAMNLDPSRKTVLICSTWGPDSLLQSEGEAFTDEINRLGSAYNLIVSLHLLNYRSLPSDRVDAVAAIKGVTAPHFHLVKPDEEGGLSHLPLADVLVTDVTSLGLFFPHFERPIVFYDIPRLGFAPVGLVPELRQVAYVIDRFTNMEAHLARAQAAFRPEAMRELARKIVSCPGNSAERHREEILESLGLLRLEASPRHASADAAPREP